MSAINFCIRLKTGQLCTGGQGLKQCLGCVQQGITGCFHFCRFYDTAAAFTTKMLYLSNTTCLKSTERVDSRNKLRDIEKRTSTWNSGMVCPCLHSRVFSFNFFALFLLPCDSSVVV